MNPPRLPERWAELYTRGLPEAVRTERLAEIVSDVHDECAVAGATTPERSTRAAVVSRTLRGVPGDLAWRAETARALRRSQRVASGRPTGTRAAWGAFTQAWFSPVAVLLGVFNVAAAVFVATEPSGKMPGQAIGPVLLVGFAATMVTGLWLRWRRRYVAPETRRAPTPRPPVSSPTLLIALTLLGAGLVALTLAWGPPIFAVVGAAMLIVAAALGLRALRRRGRPGAGEAATTRTPSWLPDALIVIGTLPAIGLFWMIVPPVLALVVIAGVVGTRPGEGAPAGA